MPTGRKSLYENLSRLIRRQKITWWKRNKYSHAQAPSVRQTNVDVEIHSAELTLESESLSLALTSSQHLKFDDIKYSKNEMHAPYELVYFVIISWSFPICARVSVSGRRMHGSNLRVVFSATNTKWHRTTKEKSYAGWEIFINHYNRKKFIAITTDFQSGHIFFFSFYSAASLYNGMKKTILQSIAIDDPDFKGDAYTSLAIIYALLSLCNWLAPSAISIIGPRGAMFIGSLAYW